MEKKVKKHHKPLDLKKGGVLWVVWNYVEAALMLVAGILAIVFSDNKDLQNTILLIVGCFLIVGGFLKILMNFLPILSATDKKALNYDFVIGGAVELALGVTLVAMPGSAASYIVSFLSTFIAIILLVTGGVFLAFAIAFIIDKLFGLVMPIIEIILGLGFIALGVVVLVYMNNEAVFFRIVLIITGAIMAITGLALIIETTRVMIVANKLKRAVKAGQGAPTNPKEEEIVTVDATEKATPEDKSESAKEATPEIEGKPGAIEAPKDEDKKTNDAK